MYKYAIPDSYGCTCELHTHILVVSGHQSLGLLQRAAAKHTTATEEAVLLFCSSTLCVRPTCGVFVSGGRSGANVERILFSVGLDKPGERLG